MRLLLVRFKSRNGWSASDPFGGLKVWGFSGGEEREARRFENNGFRLLLLLIRGVRRKMNSVIQNVTVLVFLFFIYIYNI